MLGRWFDVRTLADALAADEDDVLDDLDAALAAGLVREDGVGSMRFAHALVRDTLSAGLSQTRRGRMHARAAETLAGRPGREAEVARHWLAAGPQHSAQAWRAAVEAGEAARRVFAYDESFELLSSAVDALALDPEATPEDEYAVLVELAKAHQNTGNWADLRPVVHRALAIARAANDLDRMLGAISLLSTNALWQAGAYGHVDDVVVSTLRAALEQLPPEDSVSRCRAMVGLASEIYYTSSHHERDALCTEAVTMARRLEDPHLLLWTLVTTSLGVWRPGTARLRYETNAEAAELARELGAGVDLSTALTLQASAASELGLPDEMDRLVGLARQQASAERHLYALLVLDGLEIPWLAMRGDFARVDELLGDMTSIHERTSVPQSGDALMGALWMKIVWGGQPEELRGVLPGLEMVTVMPVHASLPAVLCRVGEIEQARAYLEAHPIDLAPDWWFSTQEGAMAAEAALCTGRKDVAADAYAALSEFTGQPACAGSGTTLGPVDAFLAMAAEATGERALATRHADDAARLCEEWRIPLAGQWFADFRSKFGF